MEELKRRLDKRGKNTFKEIESRLLLAKEELKMKKKYDYILVNEVLDKTVENIEEIIDSSQSRS